LTRIYESNEGFDDPVIDILFFAGWDSGHRFGWQAGVINFLLCK